MIKPGQTSKPARGPIIFPNEKVPAREQERIFGSDEERRTRLRKTIAEQKRAQLTRFDESRLGLNAAVIDRDKAFGKDGIYSIPLDKVIHNTAHQREIERTTNFRFHCLH